MSVADKFINMREQLEKFLQNKQIPKQDIRIIWNFFIHLPYDFRQIMSDIFLTRPEFLIIFVNLLKKKREFAKNPTKYLAEEILNLEKEEMEKLYV